MDDKELKNYEISFLTKEEGGREAIIQLLKKHGIEISKEGQMAKIKFAYPVKKEQFGHFGYVYFSASPEILGALKDGLKINPQVLRFSLSLMLPREEREKKFFSRQSRRPAYGRAESKAVGAEVPGEEQKVPRHKEGLAPRQTQEEFKGELSNEALEKKLEEILKE